MSSAVSTTKLWPFWANETQKLKHALAGLENFTAHHACLGVDRKSGLALDEATRRICFLTIQSTAIRRAVHSCEAITGIEIIEDGRTLAASSAGAASPARGGTVRTFALRLSLHEPSQPGEPVAHIVKLLDKPVSRESTAFKTALDSARQWHRLLLASQHVHTLRGSIASKA